MRPGLLGSGLARAAVFLLLATLGGCVPPTSGGGGHPNLVIIREFSFSPSVVTLDSSFGFSLYRGSPGVPPRQRAESVGRAAAFSLADTAAQQLGSLGYDVVRSDTAMPEPGGRALIVTGTFQRINEGHRRHVGAENASVIVDAEIDVQSAGAAAQRVMALQLDSRRVPRDAVIAASGSRGTSVNTAAARVGSALARTVSETARLNNWPAAPR